MNTEAKGDSNEILEEFFGGGGQFQQVRKKAMRRPGRSPAKQVILNKLEEKSALGEANTDTASESQSLPKPKPLVKKQRSVKEKCVRVVKTEKEVKDLHLEDRNVVSDLIHRVTQISGLEPGTKRVVKTPPNMVERGQAMKDLQFKEFMDPTEHFKDTIGSIIEIHKEIDVMSQNIFYFRQALGRDLKDLNNVFIKQFQLLISEILTMQRNKFQSQTETVNALLHRLDKLEKELRESTERCEVLESNKSILEADNERMAALCDNKDMTIKMLQDELNAAEKAQKEFTEMMEKQKIEEAKEREKRKESDKLMMMQERALLLKQRQDLQAELMRQNALAQESAIIKNNKIQAKIKKEQGVFKAVNKKVDGSSQTEYDDFGAWDRQSGWTLPISGTVKARNRWRKSLLYATCPSCRGLGAFMSAAAAQYKFFLRGEVIVDKDYDPKKWRIPDQIVRFMSNLPRAIQTEPLHDTKWVIRHVWNFFDFKVKTDADDITLGQPLQVFADFIIDTLLQRCERRVDAESYLYVFLKTLQGCLARKKTPILHSFARFLGVYGTTDEENESELVSSPKGKGSPMKSKQQFEREPKGQRKTTVGNRGTKVSVDQTSLKVPNSNLSRGVLDVYLFSRSCMLKPYRGMYATGIEAAKAATTGNNNLGLNQSKLEGSADDHKAGWGLNIPDHVCVSDNLTAWVPLDRALQVSTAVLGFLSEKQMLAVHRQIEHEALFLNKHGELVEPEGSHTVIRAAVRTILKQGVEKKSEDEGDSSDETVIMVNLEKVLQATIQQLSSRISLVETRLVRLFADGDDNGDGELSFREFTAIVNKVAPHFSTRTQLKMFREALMSGNDNSAITERSFVSVCRKYGLVQLVDMESMQQQVSEHFNEVDKDKDGDGDGDGSPSRPVKGNAKSVSESIVMATHKALKEKKDGKVVHELQISKPENGLSPIGEDNGDTISNLKSSGNNNDGSIEQRPCDQPSLVEKSRSEEMVASSEEAEIHLLQMIEARIRRMSSGSAAIGGGKDHSEQREDFSSLQGEKLDGNTGSTQQQSSYPSAGRYAVLIDDSDSDSEKENDSDDDDEELRRMIRMNNNM